MYVNVLKPQEVSVSHAMCVASFLQLNVSHTDISFFRLLHTEKMKNVLAAAG